MIDYSYLQDQVQLLQIPATCFFTKEEREIFRQMFQEGEDKHALQEELTKLIAAHEGPRELNIETIVDRNLLSDDYKIYYTDDNGELKYHYRLPEYISFDQIKLEYRITEFCSELSRCAGIPVNGVFYDKIVICWRSIDTMQQLVKNGFVFKYTDGVNNYTKHYSFFTASASNLRRDKFQVLSDDCFNKVENQLFAGLNAEQINAHGGVNVSKLCAYRALPGSATKRWCNPDGSKFSIRNCIVVPDYLGDLNCDICWIQKDGIKTGMALDILEEYIGKNCADGAGIALPGVLPNKTKNCVCRGPWVKGLLGTMNFLEFCEVNHCDPVVTDFWGKQHDLVKENIKVIMTESMFKMAKMYDSWEEYCTAFEKYDCWLCTLKPEPESYDDMGTRCNYQFLNGVTELTNDDIAEILSDPIAKLQMIKTDRRSMLKVCGADINADDYSSKCLAAYPELIKAGNFRVTLKDTFVSKRDKLRASTFDWNAKRCFCLPDLYALCENIFLHIKNPEGLIPANKVIYKHAAGKEVAILRSPCLAIDQCIVECLPNNREPEITNPYYWLDSNAIYVSSHDGNSFNLNLD